MIPVVKPYFPSFDIYVEKLKQIWSSQLLTNNGPFVKELESKLKDYTGIDRLMLTCNGTIPIMAALNLFGKGGEIITTPFSYIATTSSILWEKCKPVFVDIDPDYLTINESLIEEKINENTTCILATHTYGNPCNIEVIERIAKKYNLKVIYDSAHCFGVNYRGKSVFQYGDVSTTSFHATKILSTGEGGAIFANNAESFKILSSKLNFGHDGPENFSTIGINGKMSELNAAYGLCVFDKIEDILQKRKTITDEYDNKLNFKKFRTIKLRQHTKWNHAYYPIIFDTSESLNKCKSSLEGKGVFPRRYFYPSLNTLAFIDPIGECPVSEDISTRVLCLPLYNDLEIEDINFISQLVNNFS
tara:strand:+ start:1005 stop:2081 length:1077 start_codon:yes stop_codon:yes gene_type:complete